MQNTSVLAALIQLGALDRNAEIGVFTESISTARRLIALNVNNETFPPESRRPETDQQLMTQEEIESLVNTLAFEQKAQLNQLAQLGKDATSRAKLVQEVLSFDRRHTLIHALNLLKFRGFDSNSASKLYQADWDIILAFRKAGLVEEALAKVLRELEYHHGNHLRCYKGLKMGENTPIIQVCFRSPVYFLAYGHPPAPLAPSKAAAGLRTDKILLFLLFVIDKF